MAVWIRTHIHADERQSAVEEIAVSEWVCVYERSIEHAYRYHFETPYGQFISNKEHMIPDKVIIITATTAWSHTNFAFGPKNEFSAWF